MKTFATLFASGTFIAAALAQAVDPTSTGETTATSATATAEFEAGIPTGYTDGETSAAGQSSQASSTGASSTGTSATITSVNAEYTSTGVQEGSESGVPIHEPIPVVSRTTIDGVVYIPETLCAGATSTAGGEYTLPTGGYGGESSTDLAGGQETTTGTGELGAPTGYTGETSAGASSTLVGGEMPGTSLTNPVGTETSVLGGPPGYTGASSAGASSTLAGGETTATSVGGLPTGYTSGVISHPTTTDLEGPGPVESGAAACQIEISRLDNPSAPRKFEIPADGMFSQLLGERGHVLRNGVRGATMRVVSCGAITDATCTAYSNRAGTEQLGEPLSISENPGKITVRDGQDNGKNRWVRAIKCEAGGAAPVESSGAYTSETAASTGTEATSTGLQPSGAYGGSETATSSGSEISATGTESSNVTGPTSEAASGMTTRYGTATSTAEGEMTTV